MVNSTSAFLSCCSWHILITHHLSYHFYSFFSTTRTVPSVLIGQPKRGDLSGIYWFDIKYKGINYEIAYTISEVNGKKLIVLLAGTRENFYEELKRYIK